MRTIKGPAIFLAQFMGDQAPFDRFDSICRLGGGTRLRRRADAVLGRALHRPREGGREPKAYCDD